MTASAWMVQERRLDVKASHAETMECWRLLGRLKDADVGGLYAIGDQVLLTGLAVESMAGTRPVCRYSVGFCRAVRAECERKGVR